MKYDLKRIMSRAWEIKKENSRNIFSLCLKMAWEEAKKPSHPLKRELIYSAEIQLDKLNKRRAKKGWNKMTMKQVYPWYYVVKKCNDEICFERIKKHFKDCEGSTLRYCTTMDELYDAPMVYGGCRWLRRG